MGASQLEVDNADLRFVCSQQSERVRLLEAELAHVHSALEETMAGSGTILPAAHKSPLVGQQEHMQAYAPVAPREPPPPLADEAAGSCYSADAQLALVARQLRAARAEVAEARARAREAEEGRGGGGGGGDASARDDAFGCGGGDGALELTDVALGDDLEAEDDHEGAGLIGGAETANESGGRELYPAASPGRRR